MLRGPRGGKGKAPGGPLRQTSVLQGRNPKPSRVPCSPATSLPTSMFPRWCGRGRASPFRVFSFFFFFFWLLWLLSAAPLSHIAGAHADCGDPPSFRSSPLAAHPLPCAATVIFRSLSPLPSLFPLPCLPLAFIVCFFLRQLLRAAASPLQGAPPGISCKSSPRPASEALAACTGASSPAI